MIGLFLPWLNLIWLSHSAQPCVKEYSSISETLNPHNRPCLMWRSHPSIWKGMQTSESWWRARQNADYLPRLLCVESWLLSIIGIYVYDDDVSSKYGFNLLCSKLTFESTWKLISFIVFTPVLKTSGKKQRKPIPLVTWYSHVPLMNHPPKLRLCLQKHAWCKKWRKRILASVDWCPEYLRSEKLTCN